MITILSFLAGVVVGWTIGFFVMWIIGGGAKWD